jgi:hypothetical protein
MNGSQYDEKIKNKPLEFTPNNGSQYDEKIKNKPLEFTPNTEEKPRGENFVKGRVCVDVAQ